MELAGGDDCHLTILPMASAEPLDTALYQRWQFEEAGCRTVDFLRFDREAADTAAIVDRLANTRGVFFSGGDQDRLLDAMAGSRLLSLVLENPELLGIGIDESTAAVFTSPTRFEVVCESQVVIWDAADANGVQSADDGDFSARSVRLHLLENGQGFDLRRRRPLGIRSEANGQ